MNVLLLGAAGFIGTNLTMKLAENQKYIITLVDYSRNYFSPMIPEKENVTIKEASFDENTDFASLLNGQDVIYHLVSTTVPITSNQRIPQELAANVVVTSQMLDACVKCGVKKVVFISSGGTVYGKESGCPLNETMVTNPITSYGIQKITIEKLLYLYQYMYGLDYRVIRLSNPYGPYQRPNGLLGAVTTFTYKALRGEKIEVYGDGTIIRDFVYIEDTVDAIIKIAEGTAGYRTFNFGCGYGTSINQLLDTIHKTLKVEMDILYKPGRKVDVPENYLDISRYEEVYGKLYPLSLQEGITKTADFIKQRYGL